MNMHSKINKSKFHAFKHAHAYIQTIRNSKFPCIQTWIFSYQEKLKVSIHANIRLLKRETQSFFMHSYIHIFLSNKQIKIDLLDERLKVCLHVGR